MTDTPNAQQARRDEVAALPRPTQLHQTSDQIREGVAAQRELADTFRVLVQEWMHEGSFTEEALAASHVERKLEGRYQPGHINVVPRDDGMFVVKVFKWNQRSEWNKEDLADRDAAALRAEHGPDHVAVVVRNSRAEHTLREYGTKLLARKKV